jgi:hypothetical protein
MFWKDCAIDNYFTSQETTVVQGEKDPYEGLWVLGEKMHKKPDGPL